MTCQQARCLRMPGLLWQSGDNPRSQMSVIVTVIAAFFAVITITRWQGHSATALGKVSAVLNVTAAFTEAWRKTNEISKRLVSEPTAVSLPTYSAPAQSSSSLVVTKAAVENDFLDENPSFRTGGIRGFSAYDRLPFD